MNIQLGGVRKGVVIVSLEDYDKLKKFKWTQSPKGYVSAVINGKNVQIHRLIMNAKKGQLVDHINRNRLDNRRENLRFFTRKKNAQNRSVRDNKKSSKYKGVYYKKGVQAYCVRIRSDGIEKIIGYFDDEIVTAECYDQYILQNEDMSHYPLNFPDKKEIIKKKVFVPTKPIKQYTNTYYGVSKSKNDYTVQIWLGYKLLHLGKYKDEKKAAEVYDKYIVDNNLYERKINFPEKYPEYMTKLNIKTYCEPYDEKSVKLIMHNKTILALVDKVDYEKIKYYKCSSSNGYVSLKVNGKTISLHRWLFNETDEDIYIDHINHNRSDNRRRNLRKSDSDLNPQNKIKRQTVKNTSNYLGVNKSQGKWESCIKKATKKLFRKRFDTEEEAARYRDLYIILKLPNDHYNKNFEWTDDEIKIWKQKLEFE